MKLWIKSKIKPQNPEKKQKPKHFLKNLHAHFDERERILHAFESRIFPTKVEGTGFSDLSRVAKVSDRTMDEVSDSFNPKIFPEKC